MQKEELIRRLMKTFVVELAEYVDLLNRDLMALERGPDPAARAEIFKSLFRTGHSLKGTARSMGIDPLAEAGHHMESLFSAIRDGAVALTPPVFEVLFATADAIKDAAARLEAGGNVAEGSVIPLLPRLQAAAAAQPVATAPVAAPKTPPPPSPSAVEEPHAEPAAPEDAVVRMSAARLERLITLGGELRVAQGRSAGRNTDIDRLLAMTGRWQADWRVVERGLRNLARTDSLEDAKTLAARAVDLGAENIRWITRQLEHLNAAVAADRKTLEQIAAPLDREVMHARMIPFAQLAGGLERIVRDLARKLGKEVDLVVEGGKIEIDRLVINAIKDPVQHLIRNAIDHGLESPEERRAAGKPARGRIIVSAALHQGMVQLVVADDGRGFDLEAIRTKAKAQGLAIPDNDADVARLAFSHGFSTSRTLTEISGRGVGLDVVKTAVESQRGACDIAFTKGQGTRFILTVPLTLTRLHALLVQTARRTYAFDGSTVRDLKRISASDLRTVEGRDMIMTAGGPVPLFRLADLLGLPQETDAGGKVSVVIAGVGEDKVGFLVDQLLAEQEVVVKDLGPKLPRVDNVSGATILPTGQIALILNVADLLRTALGRAPSPVLVRALDFGGARRDNGPLVADDSLTTRTLVKSILEAGGYEVLDAPDGMAAWQILQEHGADLVVSDVEMPRMDGFALTEAIRGSKRLRDVPIILVTALEAEQDRMRGLNAGADAYLAKSAFDQTNLIQTIERLI